MILSGIFLIVMTVLAGLVAFLIGLVGWVVLKLMKEELHLDIKVRAEKQEG